MKKLFVIFLCCNFWSYIFGARILGVLHTPTNSHNKIGVTLLKGLAERGHEVTILSGLDPKLNNSNVKYIFLDGALEVLSKNYYIFNSSRIENSFAYYMFVYSLTNGLAENALKSNAMQKLMKSGEKYDIVIIEPFYNQALVGLGQHFNAQIIVLSTSNSYLPHTLFGNEVPYSFVPNTMSSYTDKMDFQERLYNSFLYFYNHIMNMIYNIPFQERLYEEYFPNGSNFYDAVKNVSLHLVNSHIMFESPRPYLPNMIPIGGLHIDPVRKLPKDIQEYLDNAKEGFIYFSLGSYIQSKHITEEKRKAILNSLAKIPLTILWKFEGELPEKPDNVKISKWFPQNDILAHPNIKLFITHGGLLSTVEAIYRGVPVLGIPFMFDQYSNIANFVALGCGESLLYPDITEETFVPKIQQILNNSSYQKNMAKASQIIRDQPESPLERAIFWTEHILKHGSSHLRPSSLDLSTVEYLLLDVLAFVVLSFLLVCLAIYYMIKYILMYITGQEHHKIE